MNRFVAASIAIPLCLGLCACAPLPSAEPDPSEQLPTAGLLESRAIPAEWGNLVAVSNSPKYPDVFQMWFQDDEGTIHMVVFNNRARSLVLESRVIVRN